jgi:hypothetical protein
MNYKVYALLEPRVKYLGVPRYIGQGADDRYQWWQGNKVDDVYGVRNWLLKLKALGLEPIVLILVDGVTRAQALAWEIGLIAMIGRRSDETGPLLNLSTGGEFGGRGCKQSAETRRKRSEALTRYYEDPVAHEKTAEAARGRFEDPGEHAKAAEAQRQYWANPAKREKAAEVHRRCAPKPGKYKGVYSIKQEGKWCARSRVNGKSPTLGCFPTDIQAAFAYDTANRLLYPGKEGYQNLVDALLDNDVRARIKADVRRRLGMLVIQAEAA